MLTSKEIIERTGISRATLNNYIASGLVPRPQVLPPGPEHGAAPRIGFFPDDTIARVEEIQRLKSQGWSIARIAEHLSAHPPAAAPAQRSGTVPPAPVTPVAAAVAASTRGDAPSVVLSLPAGPLGHPAYLVNDAFRITWSNDETRSDARSPLAQRAGVQGTSIFSQLLSVDPAKGGDAILRFHLRVAQARGATAGALFRDLPPDEASRLHRLYDEPSRGDAGLLMQAAIPAGNGLPARTVYAVQFREGVLFAYAAQDESGSVAVPVPAQRPVAAPVITPVSVLVSTLEDASGLWVKLTAQEYFELLNEIWAELDRVFRKHKGRAGPQGGEVLVCYFLPQEGGSHLWNALAAAQQAREAMRHLSQRWQARKGWELELAMNVGIDEGQEWMGVVGATGEGALRVVGDTADHAEQLSRVSREGAILVTRSLLGKLPADQRQRVRFGVPRLEGTRSETPLLSTFARLADIAAPQAVPARVAGLAAAELIDLQPLNGTTRPQEG
ncbi:MerR family transcriptional regulator [Ramlibacter sp. USB13]|uniref:MerR family transcriptional regulator n=1 Tax=Ramlibacter cellulosilyticus TaxID=2764187 RepID=A0A923SB66_9BURK|nr:adenylate/guanylate cyclase domain-containing protein [Ramlibacter cellulosilyticus]MBC5783536.1 MerR family transcriptional regulator [Ramlibacter cellulosilyticus]